MPNTALLIVGVALILGGALILWRDVRKHHRLTALQNGPGHDIVAEHITFAEVDISYPDTPSEQSSSLPAAPEHSPLSELRDTIERVSAEIADQERPGMQRSSQLEADWSRLIARIDTSVDAINKTLRDVSLVIGPPGQTGWSCNNHGYGHFRRLLLAGNSIAWMRLELTLDKLFICSIRSHNDEKAALNANESISAAPLSDQRITGLISSAVQPITKYAARNNSKLMSERDLSEVIWQETEELVMAAVDGASTALAESGSGLEPLGPAEWDGAAKRHRLVARVMLGDDQVAKIYIERPTPRHIECLVVPPSGALTNLSRRHRIDTSDLSVAKLAELYVSCAWPSIEHAWNARHGINGAQT